MRTTEGERQVDVIYRRIDDDFLDPMQFRPDSVLGVAGVLNAARAGNVVISSAVGNGVGDDKLVYTYVPTIIEYYLGEKPLLANVDTLRCWLEAEREAVLDSIRELVIKPVEGSGGYGIVFGPSASEKELNTVAKKIRADPAGGSPSRSSSSRRCRPRSATTSRRATSTCARSPSTTARMSGCCPVG